MLITGLPQEILLELFKAADPLDIVRARSICRTLKIHAEDQLLWQTHFLALFDPLPIAPPCWMEACVKRLKAARVIEAGSITLLHQSAAETCGALIEMAETASIESDKTRSYLEKLYLTASELLLESETSYTRRKLRSAATSDSQLLARCRLLEAATTVPRVHRIASRSLVYNLERYGPETWWGPFMPDGTVDWVLLEAVHAVIAPNIASRFPSEFMDEEDTFDVGGNLCRPPPSGFQHTLPWPARILPDSEEGDWAGVETYVLQGTYSFLDYSRFSAYNSNSGQRPPLDHNYEGLGELMFMKLQLLPEPFSAATDSSHIPTSGRRKTLYFRGTSSSLPDEGDRAISGSVLETPDHQIRWRFMVAYGGEDRWALEGVQLGQRASICCSWSDASRDENGPVGACLYWRAPLEAEISA